MTDLFLHLLLPNSSNQFAESAHKRNVLATATVKQQYRYAWIHYRLTSVTEITCADIKRTECCSSYLCHSDHYHQNTKLTALKKLLDTEIQHQAYGFPNGLFCCWASFFFFFFLVMPQWKYLSKGGYKNIHSHQDIHSSSSLWWLKVSYF